MPYGRSLLASFVVVAALAPPAARADVVQVGQVAVVEGDDTTIDSTGAQPSVRLGAITRNVIEKFGDNFQTMTLWVTFDEGSNPGAEAYERTVRTDVRGLGITPRDDTLAFGSKGVLRSILNMKQVWARVGQDTAEAWRPHLETWGQESGHRWMLHLLFRDQRTGKASDALLGRDCAHYSRFVDTQGSVHDGFEWTDNKNGTFTVGARSTYRYGNLDLYGMGLMAADELPSFFFIDNIPGYQRPPCGSYNSTPRPLDKTIAGTRVDISAADIVWANGPRVPAAYEPLGGQPQDYFREAQVVVTRPGQTAQDRLVQQVALRVDKARLFWEEWMRTATDRRMVVCTQISGDCGDPRSDVVDLIWNQARQSPQAGRLRMEVELHNPGGRAATKVDLSFKAELPGRMVNTSMAAGQLAPGARVRLPVDVDTSGVACGTPMPVQAISQSDFHRHRLRRTVFVGCESVAVEGFEAEAGWRINPDGTDTSKGAVWERGAPEWTEIVNGEAVQPGHAQEGNVALVTGAAAAGGARSPFVHSGRTTVESPVFEGGAWREPRLRYWVSFAGLQSDGSGGVVPSAASRLLVQARALAGAAGPDGGPSDAGTSGTDWVEVDRLEGLITENWIERVAVMPPAISGARFQLRFVAEDANPAQGGVEAAIDAVEIFSNLPACYEAVVPERRKGGGGCAVFADHRSAGPCWLVAIASALTIIGLSRRRRRLRR